MAPAPLVYVVQNGSPLLDDLANPSSSHSFHLHQNTPGTNPDLVKAYVLRIFGAQGDGLGESLAVGNFDGIHGLELALGAPNCSNNDGMVYVLTNLQAPISYLNPLVTLNGYAEMSSDWKTFLYDSSGLVVETNRHLLSYFQGEGGEEVGFALGSGDIDGNSIDDLVVGAPFFQGSTSTVGTAYIAYGHYGYERFNGWTGGVGSEPPANPYQLPYLSVDPYSYFGMDVAVLGNTSAGAQAGWAVATADINSDGLADPIIGLPLFDFFYGWEDTGYVYAERGGDGLRGYRGFHAAPDWVVVPGREGGMLGISIAVGHMDNDDYADMAFAADPGIEKGKVFLIRGRP